MRPVRANNSAELPLTVVERGRSEGRVTRVGDLFLTRCAAREWSLISERSSKPLRNASDDASHRFGGAGAFEDDRGGSGARARGIADG